MDYLSRLQNRLKWLYSAKNLKVNALVLLRGDNASLNWPLAKIVEVQKVLMEKSLVDALP